MCADYQITQNPELEPYIQNIPFPTSEELLSRMVCCARYTELDFTAAYNQLCVDSQSALAQVVITPFSLYKVNVLDRTVYLLGVHL